MQSISLLMNEMVIKLFFNFCFNVSTESMLSGTSGKKSCLVQISKFCFQSLFKHAIILDVMRRNKPTQPTTLISS